MKWSMLPAVWLYVINLAAFVICGLDKSYAIKKRRRIPEKTLLWSAVLGGSAGFLLGMLIFRHKTKHPKFYILVPLILAAQLFAAWYILK